MFAKKLKTDPLDHNPFQFNDITHRYNPFNEGKVNIVQGDNMIHVSTEDF